jgi:prepilin-type N-terminal cleavage/methylation domain-containing protein
MRYNKNKGFTIVELAIVLVVIGIILGMAVKGKALVDAARMKAEVAKINKFEAAIAIFFASNNYSMPDVVASGLNPGIARSVFLERGILTNADFEQKIDNLEWGIYRCHVLPSDDSRYYSSSTQTQGYTASFCISTSSDTSTGIFWDRVPMSGKFICNVEAVRDDENVTTGHGRGWGMVLTQPADPEKYRNCADWTQAEGGLYGYKIL